MVRIPIQLTRKQAQRLKALAADRGTSISALVRAAVDSCFGSDGSGLSVSAPGGLKKGTQGFADGQKRHDRPVLTLEELEELLKNR